MSAEDLEQTLARLEQRLVRLEEFVGMTERVENPPPAPGKSPFEVFTPPEAVAPRSVPPIIVHVEAEAEANGGDSSPPSAEPEAFHDSLTAGIRKANALRDLFGSRSPQSSVGAPAASDAGAPAKPTENPTGTFSPHPPGSEFPPYRPPTIEKPERPGLSLEVLIGGRVMAWVGALAVVVAVGFFVKLAFNQGWLGRLSPSLRCMLCGGFGLALLGAGEFCLRRFGRAAAVGLYGAGLGTLYLTALAAYRHFEILTQAQAFVLLALVALTGFALTVRGRMLVIGVLSVLAGYLSPALLAGHSASPIALPVYLTMLMAISFSLSAARARFTPLRYLALVGQAIIGFGWLQSEVATHQLSAMLFISAWWCIVAIEAVRTARRDRAALGNVASTLLATFLFTAAGCWILDHFRQTGPDLLGAFAAAISLISVGMVMQFGTGLRALRQRRLRSAIDKLSVALWVQAGILYTLAIALQFKNVGQTIGWLATAVGCIEIGRRLRSRGLDSFGLVLGALAVARLVFYDIDLPSLRIHLFESSYLTISRWALLAVAAIFAAHLMARRIRIGRKQEWVQVPVVLAALGTLGWVMLCRLQTRDVAMSGGWLIAAVLLFAFERVGRKQRYLELGLLVLVATTGRWLIFDSLMQRLSPDWDALARTPVLNGQMGIAAGIVACSAWATHILRRRALERPLNTVDKPLPVLWQNVFIACSTLLLIALSLEVDRTVVSLALRGASLAWSVTQLRLLLLTILWSLGALAVGIVGGILETAPAESPRQRMPLLLQFAWAILILCAIKFVTADTLLTPVWHEVRVAAVVAPLPVLNVEMLAAIALCGCALLLGRRMGWTSDTHADANAIAKLLPVAASIVMLWSFSFELDRFIGQLESRGAHWAWPRDQLRTIWLTLLWAVGGLAMAAYGRWRPRRKMVDIGTFLACGAAVVWLSFGTFINSSDHPALAPALIVNLQFCSGIALIFLLAFLMRTLRRNAPVDAPIRRIAIAFALILAIGLWLGTLEIDRYFSPTLQQFANARLARQTGFSLYWGLYGIGLIALGFGRRIARCRHAGLALLSLTLAKVVLVDLSGVGYAYRVLSLMAVGLLLVVTSVAYARLGPRFLGQDISPEIDEPPVASPPVA